MAARKMVGAAVLALAACAVVAGMCGAHEMIAWSADGRAAPLLPSAACVGHDQRPSDPTCEYSDGSRLDETVLLRVARGDLLASDATQHEPGPSRGRPAITVVVVQDAPLDVKQVERALKIASHKLDQEPAWLRASFTSSGSSDQKIIQELERATGATSVTACVLASLERTLDTMERTAGRTDNAHSTELVVVFLGDENLAEELYAPRDPVRGLNGFEAVADAAYRLARLVDNKVVLVWTENVPQLGSRALLEQVRREDQPEEGDDDAFAPPRANEPELLADNSDDGEQVGTKKNNSQQFSFTQKGDLPPPPISPAGFMGLLVMLLLVTIFYFGFSCLFAIQTPYAFASPDGDAAAKKNQ
ncbi:hypothetical protein FVE85_1064 [Porphyridium purpureum]|uniref:V-type proton ATPase subunit S1/VOA1 transmembrane domain-containing protein n=1 Tax=Porphyridium purpureum TaxID=35688 RepID=A0A5J4Z229_PORPP|nr:hypothetical protein FVE85_1064 [Porphyridium purpureum]|eukprot:POR8030..scf208_2